MRLRQQNWSFEVGGGVDNALYRRLPVLVALAANERIYP